MKQIGELSNLEIRGRLRGEGLVLGAGPYLMRIKSEIDLIAEGIGLLYEHHVCYDDVGFCDFNLNFTVSGGLRRWYKPKMRFYFGCEEPFLPLPAHQAMPLFEWAINWSMANHSHQYLVIHAACLEKEGKGLVMPAPPGSGKSTLCAGLASRGWRLLSDELAIIDMVDGELVGLARPISLKGRSIDVIKDFAPDSVFSAGVMTETKGLVAHVKPSSESVERVGEKVLPTKIVFPRWVEGVESKLTKREKGKTFLEIAENSFNYSMLGRDGFEAMGRLIGGCSCYDFEYSDLADAVRVFDGFDEDTGFAGGEIEVYQNGGEL